jgi:hypothetical protein
MNDEARGSGCGLDKKSVWSSSRCETSGGGGAVHALAQGSSLGGDAVTCTSSDNEEAAVRCCADEPIPSKVKSKPVLIFCFAFSPAYVFFFFSPLFVCKYISLFV